MSLMEYKGYHASIMYDNDDRIFIGTVIGINDSISFHGSNVEELQQKFESGIDDYLEMCETIGKVPDKEYKGLLNLRIRPEDHKAAALVAASEGISINQLFSTLIHEGLIKKMQKLSLV